MQMIAYNNEWLHNLYVRELADEALHEKNISEESYAAIYTASPVGFYTPNIYARIGLAFSAMVIVAFTCGFFALLILSSSDTSKAFTSIVVAIGIVCYVMAESFIKTRNHYNSGTDNMLVWMSGVLVYMGLAEILDMHVSNTIHGAIALAISLFLALRFADMLMSVFAFISLLCLVFFGFSKLGSFGMNAVPFILMLVSGLVYYLATIRGKEYPLYRNCIYYVKLASLLALYAVGNYFVVIALSMRLYVFSENVQYHQPMGWFFWLWTFAVPAIYVALGIRNKDLMLIRTGILLVVAAIFTFRYYHSVLPVEIALTLGGAILITVSYLLINYLKTPHGRFTFEPGYTGRDKTIVENLIGDELTGKHRNDDGPAHGDNGGW